MNSESMTELRKFVAPEFIFGVGALSLAGRYAKSFSAKKALVVTDPGLIEAGWVEKVVRSLDAENIPSVIFQDVTSNPRDHEVMAGVRFYQENECNVIVAVGGGSPMDCAKGIGIAHANGKDILEFEGVDEVPLPGPPVICIPTTAGTSADVSQFCIITDTARKVKIAIVSKMLVSDVALIDPETTTTMSADLTASTGLDALVHAIEAYVSNASSPLTDLNAWGAMPLIMQNLIPAIENPLDLKYRNDMMMGSLLAGLAFSNASLGLTHALSHSLGGLLDSPHGMWNVLMLDHVVDFNYPAASDRYNKIGEAMGLSLDGLESDRCRELLLNRIAMLREEVGLKTTIGEQGVSPEDIPQLSSNAFHDPCVVTNPREVGISDIERIFKHALEIR